MIKDSRIVLGITGSIAAYKGADLASKLTQGGAIVDVVMTKAACELIRPMTFKALTNRPIHTDMWDVAHEGISHIELAKAADAVLIAPASADFIAKLAYGLADDILSATVLATRSPIVIAPAMNVNMYENSITQENIQKLKDRGFIFIEPAEGHLACGDVGRGKLADVEDIIGEMHKIIGRSGPMAGKKVVVTAGGTREPIDSVRFISNLSSGKMGYAIAEAARDQGANVVLVTSSQIKCPAGIEPVHVQTALEMRDAVHKACKDADAIIMAAAVADYHLETPFKNKIKKKSATLDLNLVRTPDIIAEVKGDLVKIGFAAESEDINKNAKAKLKKKGLDLIVANDVTQDAWGFGSEYNKVTLIDPEGNVNEYPVMTKRKVADLILDWLTSSPKWVK